MSSYGNPNVYITQTCRYALNSEASHNECPGLQVDCRCQCHDLQRATSGRVSVAWRKFDLSDGGHTDIEDWAQDLIEQGRAKRPAGSNPNPQSAVFTGSARGERELVEHGDFIAVDADGEFYAEQSFWNEYRDSPDYGQDRTTNREETA